MVFLDLKQNGKKIALRILLLFGLTFLILLVGSTGLFERIKPLLENVPEYIKPMLGVSDNVDLMNGKVWILFFSMIVEFYFLYIAFMDPWNYLSENEDKQRFLFIGNQMYTEIEYVLYGYLFLLVQFFAMWVPYKIALSLICDSMFLTIPTILNGMGIYLVLIAIGYLVSVLGVSREISPEFLYIITIFTFVIGNVYKFFVAMNARVIELGEFPNENLIILSEKTKGLHVYSLASYLNPFRVDTMAIGVKGFILGTFLAIIICALTIFAYRNQEH